jgi:hypothetical protein
MQVVVDQQVTALATGALVAEAAAAVVVMAVIMMLHLTVVEVEVQAHLDPVATAAATDFKVL